MNPEHSDPFAIWTVPETSFSVLYSLGLFHEIDFTVNEGFRRIPHGGVEIGGLLFGRLDQKSIRIDAFRPIECEHAFGPSFVLSERDLGLLQQQIDASTSDPELEGRELLGWFIAHTRSPLVMNDREAVLFDQLFPGPGRVTVLVKPERFQPTRFSFLARGEDGRTARDGTRDAIILPLPGRGTRRDREQPIPSIPAPPEKQVLEIPVSTRTAKPEREIPITPAPRVEEFRPPQPGMNEPTASAPSFISESTPGEPPPVQPVEAPISRQAPRAEPLDATRVISPGTTPLPPSADDLPPIEEIKRRRSEKVESARSTDLPVARQEITRKATPRGRGANTRLAAVLVLAAALGCAVGYWGYVQLPAATIPLTVHVQQSKLLISWPAAQTRDARYVALRIDDGDPVPLSADQKMTGMIGITPGTSGNTKIELLAQHWMRDSRGIVRYVTAPNSPPAQVPASSPANQH